MTPHRSLRTRVLIFTVLPIATLTLATLWTVNQRVTRQVESGVRDDLRRSSAVVENVLNARLRALALASDVIVRASLKELTDEGYLHSQPLIDAFEKIDRIDFVPAEQRENAYANHPLPIGFSQTISQPLTVAFMLELLAPKAGELRARLAAWRTEVGAQLPSPNPNYDPARVWESERPAGGKAKAKKR